MSEAELVGRAVGGVEICIDREGFGRGEGFADEVGLVGIARGWIVS